MLAARQRQAARQREMPVRRRGGDRQRQPGYFLAGELGAWRADAAVMSDMAMLGPGRPAITESLRGALSVELEFRGQRQDLHSGNFGGAIHNPLQALCEVVARLHRRERHHRDPAASMSGCGRRRARNGAYMARVGPSDEQILRDARRRASDGASRASASTSASRSVPR